MRGYTEVAEAFRSHANPEKAAAMSAYMRNQFSYLGIQTPLRKQLQKEFIKATKKEPVDWDFVTECWQLPQREFQYLVKDYLSAVQVQLVPNDIPRLRALAVDKSWWDTIDGLDQIIGDIALCYPEVNKTLLAWSEDENIWLRRIAIDHQLMRKDKTDTKLLEQIICNNFGQTEFFINKAIGWALRQYSKTSAEWVQSFIEKHGEQMAPLSIKEASKYLSKP